MIKTLKSGIKLIDGSGSFSRHAREEPAPVQTGAGIQDVPVQTRKRILDSRLRGNDKGAMKKFPRLLN